MSSDDEADASGLSADDPAADREAEAARSGRSSSGGMSDWVDALRDMAPYLDLGWRLAASVSGPPILGHLLVDRWWGTTPWGVLVGAGIGIVGAVVLLRRLQTELDR